MLFCGETNKNKKNGEKNMNDKTKKEIYKLAQNLFAKGATINGSASIAKALNATNSGKQYTGGRGIFNAIGSTYRQVHAEGKPDDWKILDAFRGKNGDHLWKKKG